MTSETIARPVHAASSRGLGPVLTYVAVALVALVVRAVPYLKPGVLTSPREYDDAVAFLASAGLASGELPYRDVVFVHPPGVLLGMLPFAAIGVGGDDAVGLGLARVAVILVGVANAVLVARLLRPLGRVAMVVGGVGYATWGAAALAERAVLLEPGINLGLLLALLALQGRGRRAALWAGVALGVAVTVKYWAAIDVLVLLALVVARGGLRGAARYLGGAGLGAGVVALPFFVAAPAAMWHQTVATQLGRPADGLPIAERGRSFAPFSGLGLPDERLPGWLWLGVLALLVVAGLAPLVVAVTRRVRPDAWRDEWWWAVLAAVHLGVLMVSASFYYHYAAWAAAPVALVGGAVAQRAWGHVPRFRHRTAVVLGAGAVAMLVVAAVAVPRASGFLGEPEPSRQPVLAWSAGKECVWGPAAELVWADAGARAVARCGVDADGFGAYLAFGASNGSAGLSGNEEWRASVARQLDAADGAVLPADRDLWWLGGEQLDEFLRDFAPAGEVGDATLWDRVAAG